MYIAIKVHTVDSKIHDNRIILFFIETGTTPVEIKALFFLFTVNQIKFIFSHSIVVQTQSCHLRAYNRNHTSNSYFGTKLPG